ncbi:MAG: hypothetical protein NTX03_00265 [Bacteroidetes bacterium]|nr:hypothetical protein [Bacteroidota bacterium]
MKLKTLALTAFAAALILSGCGKKNTNPDNGNLLPDNSTMAKTILKFQPVLQPFYFDNTAGGTVATPLGTKVSFIPNAFVDSTGKVINDKVFIQIREAYKRSEMIMLDLHTIDDNKKLLGSAGMIYLNATYKGKNINVKSGLSDGSVIVKMPYDSSNTSGNNIFINFYPLPQNDNVWVRYKAVSTSGNDSISVAGNPAKNVLNLNKVYNWINADHFYHAGSQLTDVTLTTFDNPTAAQTRAYVIFRDDKAILPLYQQSDNKYYATGVPVGYNAYLLVITVRYDKMWASLKAISTTPNITADMRMVEYPDTDFKILMEKLDK